MSGFQHAPVTQTLLITTTIASLTISLSGLAPYAPLRLAPHMTTHHQWWRLLTFQLAYSNSVELLMCLQVLYNAGVQVERTFGSSKYAAFCLLAHIAATLSALPTILLINSLPAGSFALIGAIATQYELATPTIYRLRVFGVPLSSKFVVYLNLLLLVWHQPKSMISLMTGGCFTLIFYPRLQHLRVPIPIIANLSSSTVAAPRRQDRTLPLEFGEMPGAREARQIAQFRRARANAAAGGEPTSIVENITGGGGVTRARQVTTRTDDDNGGSGSRDDDDENTALPQALGAPGAAETRATTRTTSSRLSRLVGQVAGRAGDVYAVGGGGSLRTSEREITTIAAMFPNLPRARIVEALQRHDWNSARAVESLLES